MFVFASFCFVIAFIVLPIILYKDNLYKIIAFTVKKIWGALRGIPNDRYEEYRACSKKMWREAMTAALCATPVYITIWLKNEISERTYDICMLISIIPYLAAIVIGVIFVKTAFQSFKIYWKLYSEITIMRYEIRDGGSLRGKQKVIFCSTAEDEELYYTQLSDEIFRKHKNIAIWRVNDPGIPLSWSERLRMEFELSSINLLIFPVTKKFLYTENDARCFLLPKALENHIPVLPFVMEDGIESEFNRICGNLQLLSLNNKELTAVAYEDKLDKFLDSVLFSDSMMERIRQAFDAYVFMSYRKKDRQYANEIMHLIHRNPFCRDIAIWYDEYLVPGENFDDSIKEACKKSELFTMVVTPNVLDNPNYVKDYEYPFAQGENMTILPIMMEETDHINLEAKYPKIPECVTPENGLVEAFEAFAAERCDKKKSKDPVHRFFIGLAYLGGIDVEKNFDFAVEMLSEAAEGGVADAYLKLIEMYEYGNGVKKSIKDGIEWREKYGDFMVSQAQKSGSDEQYALALETMIGTYYRSIYLWDNERHEKEIKRIEDIRAYFNSDDMELSEELRVYMAELYDARAEYFKSLNDEERKLYYLEKSNELADSIRNSDEDYVKCAYAIIKYEIGKMYFESGESYYELARTHIEEALEMNNILAEKRGDELDYTNQKDCLISLAQIAAFTCNTYASIEYLNNAQSVIDRRGITLSDNEKLDKAINCCLIGEQIKSENTNEAIGYFNKSFDILTSMEKDMFEIDHTEFERNKFTYFLTLTYFYLGQLGDSEKKAISKERIDRALEDDPEDELIRALLESYD